MRPTIIEYNGQSKSLREWCKLLGVENDTMWKRLYKNKWPITKAFNYKEKSSQEAFYDYVYYSIDGCWYWMGLLNKQGYGRMGKGSKTMYAHRISYEMHKGEIGNLCVLHSCDNPSCVNPDHLFLGTLADNNADMMRKGRHRHGSSGKLTKEQVIGIIKILNTVARDLATNHSVHEDTIKNIWLGKTWKNVTI